MDPMKHIKEDLDAIVMDTLNIKAEQILKIGEGAWHTVYQLKRVDDQDLVIRMKKMMLMANYNRLMNKS